ncbi:MAG: helix-turn-helix domain-containing protein [Candidatus Methanospirareceae archaeon]
MFKKRKRIEEEEFHPNAYLVHRRNVIDGLRARTRIIEVLMANEEEMSAREISEVSELSYSSSFHHLRLLEEERIVRREGRRPYRWRLTGLGQKRLEEIESREGG